ncbi:hypothetical protein BTO00_22670, partial [Vibrio campbellii]|uniref:hypothetical protein n=1 Tax=Vibrio campbellii TaxID=680 RepID=UPI000D479DB6
NSANIDAEWYLIDSPTQVSSPTSWQSLSAPLTNTSLNGEDGRYLLLALSYSESGQVLTRETLVSDAILAGNTPDELRRWFGGLAVTPDNPASIASTASLFAQDDEQTVSPDAGVYDVSYEYISDKARNESFDSLVDLTLAYPDTQLVRVIAHQVSQSTPSITQTLISEVMPFVPRPSYVDSVVLVTDTTTVTAPQQVLALLSNSFGGERIAPTVIEYQWQTSIDSIRWEDIVDATERFFQVTAKEEQVGQLRVQVTMDDELTPLLGPLPILHSNTVAVEPTKITDWAITTNIEFDQGPIGQRLIAKHRALKEGESVRYQWYRAQSKESWNNAQAIEGANEPYFDVTQEFDRGFVGVRGEIVNASLNAATAESPISGPFVLIDDTSFVLSILPHTLYQNSALDYSLGILRNGQMSTAVDGAEISVIWYVVDEPIHRYDRNLWQPLEAATLTSAQSNKWVLLSLEYKEEDKLFNLLKISDGPVTNDASPEYFSSWFSGITYTPSDPVMVYSDLEMISENDEEIYNLDSGLYTQTAVFILT